MALNDPVLQRSMFQKQGPAMAPAVGLGGGLGSMTTPDENAKALRSMFAPTVDLNMPSQMLGQEQQAVQSFQEGGLAEPVPIDEVESQYVKQLPPPTSQFRRDLSRLAGPMPSLDPNAVDPATQRFMQGREEFLRRRGNIERNVEALREVSQTPAPPSYFEPMPEAEYRRRTEESFAPLREAQRVAQARLAAQAASGGVSSLNAARMLENDRAQENRLTFEGLAAAKPKDDQSISTKLDDIRQERLGKEQARSAAERRENMLLALMQAGFAMAAGRSPNAISNIGAGGQAGIAAFAGMERARREDEAMRRREALQLDIAKMQLERDPEAVRTYAILGGYKPGDSKEAYQTAVQKGFQFLQTKEAPSQAAKLLELATRNPGLYSETDMKNLANVAYGSVRGALTGEGKPPAGTVIPWNQLAPK